MLKAVAVDDANLILRYIEFFEFSLFLEIRQISQFIVCEVDHFTIDLARIENEEIY